MRKHDQCISPEEAFRMWECIRKIENEYVKNDDWFRTLNDYLKLSRRVEELENHKDDWKIWLEGFTEGFAVKNKGVKK